MRGYAQWHSLYVQSEVYEAQAAIVAECREASKVRLFAFRHGRTLSLEEFETQQTHAMHEAADYLRDRWTANVAQCARMCMRDLGKGWFDLGQRRHDVYDFMKLKRFFELTRQRMQVIMWFTSAIRLYVYLRNLK